MLKANILSLSFKVLGCFLIISSLILNAFGVTDIAMTEVLTGVLAMEALVLPIDISKIKNAGLQK